MADIDGKIQLNGLTGKILSYNSHTQQYHVKILSRMGNSLPGYERSLSPEVMEPIYHIKEDRNAPYQLSRDKTESYPGVLDVKIPNIFAGPQRNGHSLVVKFHLKVFELTLKRFVRPENPSNGISENALKAELLKIENEE
jgi:hypothetical protein